MYPLAVHLGRPASRLQRVSLMNPLAPHLGRPGLRLKPCILDVIHLQCISIYLGPYVARGAGTLRIWGRLVGGTVAGPENKHSHN